jgi:murein DD-endopeptidase MepM/ murein hydrolase activator NlpD
MPPICMLRRSLAAASCAVALFGSAAAVGAAPSCLVPPVVAPVIDPFRAPACTWCPGHRGIEYGTRPHTVVRAAAAGKVSFAHSVAGSVWVTVVHAGDLASSYGPMARVDVRRGDSVRAGQSLGTSVGALHFGLRLDGRYVDPAPLLGRPPHLVPRLVPLHARLAPVPALRCPARSAFT